MPVCGKKHCQLWMTVNDEDVKGEDVKNEDVKVEDDVARHPCAIYRLGQVWLGMR